MTASNYPPPAELRFHAQDCAAYASAITKSLGVFEAAGLRISNSSRLRTAARLLERVAKTGVFPTRRDELRRLANAMSDASDFFDIARELPTGRGEEILAQLRQALKGSLEDNRRRQTPYRFQSQFWLGTVLARGGYHPRVPASETASPDFVVEEGLSLYGVEVKRPESAASALALLAEGATQLRSYKVSGLLIFDLSECVGVEALAHVAIGDEIDARDELLARFRDVFTKLRSRALDETTHRLRKGFEKVIGLIGLARGWSWIAASPPGLALFATAGASMFFSPVRNVLYYHSIDLVAKTIRGLQEVGYDFEDFEKVARPFTPLGFSWRL